MGTYRQILTQSLSFGSCLASLTTGKPGSESSTQTPFRNASVAFSTGHMPCTFPKTASVLTTVFPVNLGYVVLRWPSFCTFSGRKPLAKSGTSFLWVGFPSCPQTSGVRHWPKPGNLSTDFILSWLATGLLVLLPYDAISSAQRLCQSTESKMHMLWYDIGTRSVLCIESANLALTEIGFADDKSHW